MSVNKRVYIIGSKGVPANYGGFETFIDKLISGKKASINYVVTGMGGEDKEYQYQGARCVQFKTKDSALGRVLHTVKALKFVYNDAKTTEGEKVLYVLGCRAGIFLLLSKKLLKKQHIKILVNPDGAEWRRAKWSGVAKKIVKICEKCLVASADIVVCDAEAIAEIIHEDFNVETSKLKFIAYGSDIYIDKASKELEKRYNEWLEEKGVNGKPYFLIVGRFVPENNFELIIKEFMRSKTSSNLMIISNVSSNKFYQSLAEETRMESDPRVKFVGTLYDQDLLKLVRARASAYIHGHEVGGTNPSLLEALGSTNINLVYDVSFNREVAGDTSYYFNDSKGNLAKVIDSIDGVSKEDAEAMGTKAKEHIKKKYSWSSIIADYEGLFKS